MSEAPVVLRWRLEPEDQARADFYALLARLFADAPDAGLLTSIAGAEPLVPAAAPSAGKGAGADLAAAWDALRAASAAMDAGAASEEFQTLFIGVGRSEVSLYASHYLGPQSGRPLAEIRAALAETMRMLVAGDDERPPAELARQRMFFDRHVVSWVFACCTAIDQSSVANYYRRVAQFSRCFLALERDSLAMD
jgi:TorA maturation chaperone TorD